MIVTVIQIGIAQDGTMILMTIRMMMSNLESLSLALVHMYRNIIKHLSKFNNKNKHINKKKVI